MVPHGLVDQRRGPPSDLPLAVSGEAGDHVSNRDVPLLAAGEAGEIRGGARRGRQCVSALVLSRSQLLRDAYRLARPVRHQDRKALSPRRDTRHDGAGRAGAGTVQSLSSLLVRGGISFHYGRDTEGAV